MFSSQDLMRLALIEASKVSKLQTYPNPRVGAALSDNQGNIVASHHKKAGLPHAEVEVIIEAQKRGIPTQGATLAVSLEPCSHYGKTPPCCEAIVRAGIRKVIVALKDPNPVVAGKGIDFLRSQGVEVELPVLSSEARELNKEWLWSHENKRSFLRLKMATSLDGLWTAENGESQWITGERARKRGGQLRGLSQLLVTGGETIRKDNPQMTARNENGLEKYQPQVWILSRKMKDFKNYKIAQHPHAPVLKNPTSLKSLLEESYQAGFFEVLVEAGPGLSHAFLSENLVNEVHLFMGSKFLGGEGLSLKALGGGTLPGLEFELSSIEKIDSENIYLKLHSKSQLSLT